MYGRGSSPHEGGGAQNGGAKNAPRGKGLQNGQGSVAILIYGPRILSLSPYAVCNRRSVGGKNGGGASHVLTGRELPSY